MHDLQAARGASLTVSRGTAAFAIAAVVTTLDQVTKALAVATLDLGERVTLIPGLINLTLHHNPGAALGTGAGYTVVLTAVAIVVTVAVITMARRLGDNGWTWAFGLLLGGAVGNLVDRMVRDPGVFRGEVVDMIDYGGFFIGNVADIALTFAAGIIIVQSVRGIGIDGSRTRE